MKPADAQTLIGKAVQTHHPERWADLGCGSGTFTRALLALLPQGSHITAIDQQPQTFSEPAIRFQQADIVKNNLSLKELDGILMANAFHYVRDKATLIKELESCFKAAPRFVFVEYDTQSSNPWVPYPISYSNLQVFFKALGYTCTLAGQMRSAFGGTLYSAVCEKPFRP